MNKRRTIIAVLAAALVSLICAITPVVVRATTIKRSKSNIANNRIVVIGTTLGQPNAPDGGQVTLLDNETGEVWRYTPKALAGSATATYLGTIDDFGEPGRIDTRYAKVP